MNIPLVKANGHKVLNYPIIKSVHYYSISSTLDMRVIESELADCSKKITRIITKKLSK